jgi:thymidylate synthase (FAD)
MKVTLLSHTPEAIKVAFTAIRTCYSANDQDYIWNEEFDKYKEKNDDHIRLIKQILNHGHTSTLEHITFNFAVNGVSRSLLAQLTRHRIGFSYSVQSQRYVKMSTDSKHGTFEFVTPPGIMSVDSLLVYDQIMEEIQKAYDKLVDMGIRAEDARYVLPNAATTNITISFNLRAFLDFYSKRNPETHAQWEIQELAESFRKEIEKAESWTKELF